MKFRMYTVCRAIQPDYVGKIVDTIEKVDVEVRWANHEQEENTVLFIKE